MNPNLGQKSAKKLNSKFTFLLWLLKGKSAAHVSDFDLVSKVDYIVNKNAVTITEKKF